MNEYISKEDAKNALLNKGQHTTRYRLGETWELNFMEILEALDTIPSADVQLVKHGYWTDLNNDAIFHYECSCCKSHTSWHENFCPDCGARMDGDTNG